ncbi:unnamed protein product, partial [Ectocarpus sp. 12 AP-2014]
SPAGGVLPAVRRAVRDAHWAGASYALRVDQGYRGGQAGRCRRAEDRGDGSEAVRGQARRGIQRGQQAQAVGRYGHDRGPA